MNNSNNQITKFSHPFFIMGCKRSGTTLVSQILDNHSRIAAYHETHYYPLFRNDIHYYGDLRHLPNLVYFINDFRNNIRVQNVTPPETNEFLEALVSPTFEGVLSTLLNLYAKRQGKIRCGDKTPEHYAYLPEILEKFPDSKVIFVMRDPRDTVLSICKIFGTSIEGAAKSWNRAFLSYHNASQHVHLVRYEELVQKPDEIIEKMCVFLGEHYEPAMLNFFERIPERFRTRPCLGKLIGPVDAGSVGKFRKMPRNEIEQIESACAAGMQIMNYPFTIYRLKNKQNVKISVPKKQNFLAFLLDRLQYYNWNYDRWRHGLVHWKRFLRVRFRYILVLGPLKTVIQKEEKMKNRQ